jgi:NADP-dependent 3-hydroxy acid dehydrogenase YdfG
MTGVRGVTIFPGDFEDISPSDPDWSLPAHSDHRLSNREVVDAILFILNQPARVTISSLVIE